jgi:hypothetical protein
MQQSKDYYAALGLDNKATETDIKKAYRRLAMTCHPDKNPDDPSAKEKFHAISEAYSTLSDREKREEYDADGTDNFSPLFWVGLLQLRLCVLACSLMPALPSLPPYSPCSVEALLAHFPHFSGTATAVSPSLPHAVTRGRSGSTASKRPRSCSAPSPPNKQSKPSNSCPSAAAPLPSDAHRCLECGLAGGKMLVTFTTTFPR